MKSRRARLVVFTILILGGITALVLLTRSSTSSLISPGALSAAHARAGLDTDSGERCADCHVSGAGLDDDLCLKCHETLAERVEQKQGYHAKLEGKSCHDCHGEHLGPAASIVRWPAPDKPFEPGGLDAEGKRIERKVFPHAVAVGFPLEGAHEKLECEGCHKPALVLDPKVIEFAKLTVAPAATAAPAITTHLGLGKDCATCHVDAHAPTFGKDCAQCHVAATWQRAERFVHDKTRFPLEGKHEQVDCAKCHIQPATTKPPAAPTPPLPTFVAIAAPAAPRPFKGVGFGEKPARPVTGDVLPECQTCHASPHRAGSTSFDRCQTCHTEADWKNGGRVAAAATFDHGKTSFALTGAHQQVTCTKCHDPKLDRAARTSCVDCHEDQHKGAFDREVAIARKSCDLCHSTAVWKPDGYAREKHPLPLIEGHAVKCESCHGSTKFARLPARPPASVGPLEESCKSCHDDVHKGKLSQDCASCHGFKSFHLAELSVEKHAEIGFPIREAHLKVTCDGCHGGRSPEGGLRRLALSEARTQGCVACHTDVHRGQFSKQGAAQDCKSCHGESHFAPSNFDEVRHAKARFALTGAHKAVPCEICHVKDVAPAPLAQRFHWDKQQRCDTCHQKDDPHRGQFKGTDCASCHQAEAWSPSTFGRDAHAKTGFQLVGGHDKVCSACHPGQGAGASAFRDTPRECAACHLDPHAGQFQGRGGIDGCGRCHNLADWKPDDFDHDAAPTRFALTGKHKEIGCNACHVSAKRAVPGGGTRDVAHFFPIEERACDDCHVNPHAKQEKR